MREIDDLLKEYYSIFFDLPPRDILIDYASDFYRDLIEKAIKSKEKITPEVFSRALKGIPYDYSIESANTNQFTNFETPKN